MIRFNAVLSVIGYTPLDSNGNYQMVVQITDNTSTFYSGNAAVGAVIFLDGSANGEPALIKYIITEIIDVSEPPNATFNCFQSDPVGGPFDPVGQYAVIGDPDAAGFIQVPDWSVQQYEPSLYTNILNFQTDMISTALASATGGGSGASNRIYDAPYTGVVDGTNDTFALTQSFIPTSLEVFLNGLLQELTKDYTLSNNNSIVFNVAPIVDENGYSDEVRFNVDPTAI